MLALGHMSLFTPSLSRHELMMQEVASLNLYLLMREVKIKGKYSFSFFPLFVHLYIPLKLQLTLKCRDHISEVPCFVT